MKNHSDYYYFFVYLIIIFDKYLSIQIELLHMLEQF